MNRLALASFVVAAGASMAFGQVIPIGAESAATSGLNTAIRSAPRVHQAYYSSVNFGSFTNPTTITGMQLKLAIGENWRPAGYVGSSWPNADLNFGSFEVVFAKPSAGLVTDGEYLSTAPTFASYLDTAVTVRTGALTIPANSFQADGGAAGEHSYGFTFNFTTPYTLNPGDGLVIQIRHSGYGTVGTPLNAFFATRGFENGVTDAISSTAGQNAASPNGFSSPYYVNLIPTPGSVALLGLAGLAGARRRRA
jgi:hypothetical protein